MTIGFDQPLYILPFDQRESFQTKMFGWEGTLSAAQTTEIAAAKQVIDADRGDDFLAGSSNRRGAIANIARIVGTMCRTEAPSNATASAAAPSVRAVGGLWAT